MFSLNIINFQFFRVGFGFSSSIRSYRKIMIPLSKSPPKSHQRRLFEAVALPILSTDPQEYAKLPAHVRCKRPPIEEEVRKKMSELSPRETAYRNYLRKHLLDATVVVLCHEHPTDARTQHYDLMEMSANGIALARLENPKVMRSVLRGSTLDPFAEFFDDDAESLTTLMYTKRYAAQEDDGRSDVVSGKVRDRNYLPLALRCAKQTSWIVPMAVAFDDRILTIAEAEKIVSMMKNPLQVRAETVALISSPMIDSSRLLDQQSIALSSALQSRMDQLESQGKAVDQKSDGEASSS